MMIADLHCDLLLYLSGNPRRTPYDLDVRCAIPQLKEGGVRCQTMAIFVETKLHSSQEGLAQAQIFAGLAKLHSLEFRRIHTSEQLLGEQGPLGVIAALENASSICDEGESLDEAFKNLDRIRRLCGPLLYISLTWNTENRFGGGAHSPIGLKSDGKKLLEHLHEKRIAVDLSHASDALGYDILNYIDKKALKIPVLASHSNFREIANVPRNLPKELAQEIIRRQGVIGLNFVRHFVGEKDPLNFVRQLEYGLTLGGQDHLCFGADFFYLDDVPLPYRKTADETFFPNYADAGSYEKVIGLWRKNLGVSPEQIKAVSCQNFLNFLTKQILI